MQDKRQNLRFRGYSPWIYIGGRKRLEVDRNISSGFTKRQARTWRRHRERAWSSTRMMAGGRR